jgi:hypothetical protein
MDAHGSHISRFRPGRTRPRTHRGVAVAPRAALVAATLVLLVLLAPGTTIPVLAAAPALAADCYDPGADPRDYASSPRQGPRGRAARCVEIEQRARQHMLRRLELEAVWEERQLWMDPEWREQECLVNAAACDIPGRD